MMHSPVCIHINVHVHRREADRLPGVVRIDAPNSHPKTECMPRVPSIKNCPEEFLPDSAWVNDICASFSDAREVPSIMAPSCEIKCNLNTVICFNRP